MPAYNLSKAQGGLGTLLQVNIGNPSPPTWTTIGEVVSIDPAFMNEFDDTTNLQSAAREVLATILQPGKWKFECNRVSTDTGQQAVMNSKFNKSRLQYQIVLPINGQAGQTAQGDVFGFFAYVEQFVPAIKGEKKISSAGTFQVSGFVNYAQGS
jgi:hypothetical protein